ncbi:hypothetical protein THMIRHAS_21760 [Thiosulfatimonas sediminis]|uniref:Uncharacterized protein n=1 Tax=Thiosulfatimonas sediminis TaxID=2675054 RepID=A0A6F8PXD2_9GAMM|nr:hypothetical protein [Thiosulfatimonas sediminis]BBP46803.1 hypothetical protein THMIRHAS_21760 [Thiosulfatimonas sediminis]
MTRLRTLNQHSIIQYITLFLASTTLSFSTFAADPSKSQANTIEKPTIQQQTQMFAICAALGDSNQQQQFKEKLTTLLENENADKKQGLSQQQINQSSANKIAILQRNYADYSSTSRELLFAKACQNDNFVMDENFTGLAIEQLPTNLQQKIRSIATCALISHSLQLQQQAQQLTAANTLIVIAAGLNGRNQALEELAELHNKIIAELKQLPEAQVKVQFEQSCGEVQKIQQERKTSTNTQ